MLFLMMHLGDDRYVLNTGQISEILPVVELKKIPQAPPAVAGAFNYRGVPVPVVDLVQLVSGRPARPSFSSRLVLISYADASGQRHQLGVITEKATETIRLNPMDFGPCGVGSVNTAYLGPVTSDERGLIQWIDPTRILPATLGERIVMESSA